MESGNSLQQDYPKITLEEIAPWATTIEPEKVEQKTKKNDNIEDPLQENPQEPEKPRHKPHPKSKFPFDEELNTKISLWKGDITQLELDAIVCPVCEFAPKDATVNVYWRILSRAGSQLIDDYKSQEAVKTGEARATKGYDLYATNVIHTVGPRYHDNFKFAAESALHSCYRSCLEVAKEKRFSAVAFPPIHSKDRGYPAENGAHISIRTIRRFLEKYGRDGVIRHVVLVLDNDREFEIYSATLPLYFPRNAQEEIAAIKLLPEDTGNEFGDTVVEERKIRIDKFPFRTHDDSDSDDDSIEEDEDVEKVRSSGLTKMTDDPDNARKSVLNQNANQPQASAQPAPVNVEAETMYAQYVKQAKVTDLTHVAKSNVIYKAGYDITGKPIIVVVGRNLPTTNPNYEHILMYIIKLLDPIADHPYTIVYCHSDMSSRTLPEFQWLKAMHNIFDAKYGKNLLKFYVIHPTIWLKLFFSFMSPFLSKDMKEKMVYITGLKDIFQIFTKEQLKLPLEIYKYDQIENGVEWIKSEPKPYSDL